MKVTLLIWFAGAVLLALFLTFFALTPGQAGGTPETPACPTPSQNPSCTTPTPTPTSTPTPTPCADNEEHLEDDSCQVTYPPEEFPPKITPTPTPRRDHTLYPPPPSVDPIPTPPASSISQPPLPQAMPDTGGEGPGDEDTPLCRNWTTGQAGDVVVPCSDDDATPIWLVLVLTLLAGVGVVVVLKAVAYRRIGK